MRIAKERLKGIRVAMVTSYLLVTGRLRCIGLIEAPKENNQELKESLASWFLTAAAQVKLYHRFMMISRLLSFLTKLFCSFPSQKQFKNV